MKINEIRKYLYFNENLSKEEVKQRFENLKEKKSLKHIPDDKLWVMARLYSAKDVPQDILNIIDEYFIELMNEEEINIFLNSFYKRKFEIFPIEGLTMIKEFFKNIESELNEIKKYVSDKRKKEKLNTLKGLLKYIESINNNEVIELELKKHRPFIDDYIKKIDIELNTINKPLPKPQLSFKDLFEHPYNSDKKINEFKELLKNNGFIDNSNNWNGKTKNKNELAILYHYLKNLPGIIKPGNFESQIIAFYKEFGRVVYKDSKDKGENGYCTIKDLRNPKNKDTKEIFILIFSNWVK